MIFVIFLFSNVFSFDTNKEDLLHVTHYIISSLLFGFVSKLFQHFMLVTYEHEMSFLSSGMNIFFSFIMICIYCKVLNTKWCSSHYVCIMWK
jgi:hypothetical protein